MIGMDSDHCQIVGKSLSGERAVDEQTFVSLAVLSDRLGRLRKVNKVFGSVAFSPAVEEFKRQEKTVAVGWKR